MAPQSALFTIHAELRQESSAFFFSPPVSVSFWFRGSAGPRMAAFRLFPASFLICSLNGVMLKNRFPVSLSSRISTDTAFSKIPRSRLHRDPPPRPPVRLPAMPPSGLPPAFESRSRLIHHPKQVNGFLRLPVKPFAQKRQSHAQTIRRNAVTGSAHYMGMNVEARSGQCLACLIQ